MNNIYAPPDALLSGLGTEIGTYEPTVFAVNGRIGRLRYLAYSFTTAFILSVVLGIVGGNAVSGLFSGGEVNVGSMIVIGLLYLAIIVTSLIIARRRLNDLNRSGWWLLLLLVPFINVIMGFYLAFGAGTQGANRFGPPPAKNSKLVVIGALVTPAIFVVGVLAAVAIPAYQQYVQRAKAVEAQQTEVQPFDAPQFVPPQSDAPRQ